MLDAASPANLEEGSTPAGIPGPWEGEDSEQLDGSGI